MKEAAGEANLTVITIVLIAIVLAVGTVIVNQALNSTAKKNACTALNGTYKSGLCSYEYIDGNANVIKRAGIKPKKCDTKVYSGGYYYESKTECHKK